MPTSTEVLVLGYPSIILVSSLLSAVVLYLVRKDTRGVLDGQDVTTQYMVDNTGEVVREEEDDGGLRRVCKVLRIRCSAATPPSRRNTGPVLFSASVSSSSSSTLFTYSIPSSLLARW